MTEARTLSRFVGESAIDYKRLLRTALGADQCRWAAEVEGIQALPQGALGVFNNTCQSPS